MSSTRNTAAVDQATAIRSGGDTTGADITGAGGTGPGGTVTLSRGRAALIAGLGLAAMIIVSVWTFSSLQSITSVSGGPQAVAQQVADHEQLLRLVACGVLVIAILDIVVAWALYTVLAPVNRALAVLAGALRVVYAAAFIATTTDLLTAARAGADQTARTADPAGWSAGINSSLDAFQDGWDAALVVFGLHLVLVGALVIAATDLPTWLGWLLVPAGVGYPVDSVGRLLLDGYTLDVARFTFVGEALLMVWLLWRGRALRDGGQAPGDVARSGE